MWMRSPLPILRVANTPRPADSVIETRIGGGPGDAGFSFSGHVELLLRKESTGNSFFLECLFGCHTQRLYRYIPYPRLPCTFGRLFAGKDGIGNNRGYQFKLLLNLDFFNLKKKYLYHVNLFFLFKINCSPLGHTFAIESKSINCYDF